MLFSLRRSRRFIDRAEPPTEHLGSTPSSELSGYPLRSEASRPVDASSGITRMPAWQEDTDRSQEGHPRGCSGPGG